MGLDSVKICAIGVLAAVCFSAVRRVNAGFDLPMRLTAFTAFLGFALTLATPLFSFIGELFEKSSINETKEILFGAVGIALLCHFSSELCRECGESGLGNLVELVGKLEIVTLCLPLVSSVLEEVEALVC